MATVTQWTRRQTLAALHVYFQLPFGQLHQRNPLIARLASWIGRTPSAVALKLVNFASLDPQVRASGRSGMGHASRFDEEIWGELNANWDAVAAEAVLTSTDRAKDSRQARMSSMEYLNLQRGGWCWPPSRFA